MKDYGRYLGLPSMIGHNKKKVFAYIQDTVRQKLQNWKNKIFSKVDKKFYESL